MSEEGGALPVLLVCGCRAHESYLRAALERFNRPGTWNLVGIIGDPTLTAPTFDDVTRILTLPVADTYAALPTKIHAALSWIERTWPDAPGVFKTDDDIIVSDIGDLAAEIHAFVANGTLYGGLTVSLCSKGLVTARRIRTDEPPNKCYGYYQTAHYCYGAGYWLSAPAVHVAVAASEDYSSSYIEDVCTGYVMNRAGFTPVRMATKYKEVPRDAALLSHHLNHCPSSDT